MLRLANYIEKAGTGAVVTALCLLSLVPFLVGCEQYEPESSEKQAESYYRSKYGERVDVSESHALGNYALFGYEYSGMEYVMADGTSVVYIDDEGVFKDNRQSEQIEAEAIAFAEQQLSEIPGALTSVYVEAVGSDVPFETYEGEGKCWHTLFEGNIQQFLSEERPVLMLPYHHSGSNYADGAFSFRVAYDGEQAESVENTYVSLGDYFDLRAITIAVVDGDAVKEKLDAEELTLFDDELLYTLAFKEDSAGGIEAVRFKPSFVALTDGVSIACATPGIALKEGDVRLEDAGKGLWECKLSGDVAEAADGGKEVAYYIQNDSDDSLLEVNGLDDFSKVCGPHERVSHANLRDGQRIFMGDEKDIRPWIEVLDATYAPMRVRYHTHFKAGIHGVEVRVIGMAYSDEKYVFESTEFESRVVGETDDGWLIEVDVPHGADVQEPLHFQLTYNGDENQFVQVDLEMP